MILLRRKAKNIGICPRILVVVKLKRNKVPVKQYHSYQHERDLGVFHSFLSRTIIKHYISYSLSKKSSTINELYALLFDPGGLVQNYHSTCVTNMFKKLTEDEMKLDEVSIMNSSGGYHKEHSQLTGKAYKRP